MKGLRESLRSYRLIRLDQEVKLYNTKSKTSLFFKITKVTPEGKTVYLNVARNMRLKIEKT